MSIVRFLRGAVSAILVSASLALAGLGVIAASAPAPAAGGGVPALASRRGRATPRRDPHPEGGGGEAAAVRVDHRQPGRRRRRAEARHAARSAENDCDGDGDPLNDRKAFQRIFGDTDGDGVFTRGSDTVLSKRFAGCSIFHVAHDHWHFEEFARYRLVKPKTEDVVASSEKVSFCVRDSIRFDAACLVRPGSSTTATARRTRSPACRSAGPTTTARRCPARSSTSAASPTAGTACATRPTPPTGSTSPTTGTTAARPSCASGVAR